MSWARLLLVLAVASVGLVAFPSCGTDAVGTDSCRKIEQARCRKAPQCPLLLLGSGGVEECAQFARDHCLHGLAVADPGAPVVDPCVSAIERGSCDVITAPDTAPECSFLRPTPAPDAGPDVESEAPAEAAPDATTEA